MFLQASVILSTGGGCLPQEQPPPPRADTPRSRPLQEQTPPGTRPSRTRYTPRTKYTPWDQVHPPGLSTPPGTKYTPREADSRHTVNERPVRILLECILVSFHSPLKADAGFSRDGAPHNFAKCSKKRKTLYEI